MRIYSREKNIKTLYWAQNRFRPGIPQDYDHGKNPKGHMKKGMSLETQVWRAKAQGFGGANEAHGLM